MNRKPLNEIFDENKELAEQVKFDRSSVLSLEKGDILLVWIPDDLPPEQCEQLMKSLQTMFKESGWGTAAPARIMLVPRTISFSVLRQKLV